MPHISVKMLKGRTEQQKQALSDALTETLCKQLNVSKIHVSVTVEDYTAKEWQQVFKEEIEDKKESLFVSPGYRPEDLL